MLLDNVVGRLIGEGIVCMVSAMYGLPQATSGFVHHTLSKMKTFTYLLLAKGYWF